MSTSGAIALDANTPTNLISQNYPRIDYHKEAMAMVWYQFSNGKQEVALQFTEDLNQGLNNVQEIVDTDFVNAVDVMLHEGNIWVIWEDEVSGTVKYRRRLLQFQRVFTLPCGRRRGTSSNPWEGVLAHFLRSITGANSLAAF